MAQWERGLTVTHDVTMGPPPHTHAVLLCPLLWQTCQFAAECDALRPSYEFVARLTCPLSASYMTNQNLCCLPEMLRTNPQMIWTKLVRILELLRISPAQKPRCGHAQRHTSDFWYHLCRHQSLELITLSSFLFLHLFVASALTQSQNGVVKTALPLLPAAGKSFKHW